LIIDIAWISGLPMPACCHAAIPATTDQELAVVCPKPIVPGDPSL
jgi:hypothetical protein